MMPPAVPAEQSPPSCESGFQVTSAAELRQQVTASDLSELTAVEHEQISHWKPATAAEILFNYWD
jgi:hypothetical protein